MANIFKKIGQGIKTVGGKILEIKSKVEGSAIMQGVANVMLPGVGGKLVSVKSSTTKALADKLQGKKPTTGSIAQAAKDVVGSIVLKQNPQLSSAFEGVGQNISSKFNQQLTGLIKHPAVGKLSATMSAGKTLIEKVTGKVPVSGNIAAASVNLAAKEIAATPEINQALRDSPMVKAQTASAKPMDANEAAMRKATIDVIMNQTEENKTMEWVKKNWWIPAGVVGLLAVGLFLNGKKTGTRRRSPARRKAAAKARTTRKRK